MFSRIGRVAAAALLLTFLFTATAYAAPANTAGLEQNVDVTNDNISNCIDQAVVAADRALAQCMMMIDNQIHLVSVDAITTDEAQAAIASIEADYQNRIDTIAASLIQKTNKKASLLIVAGNRYGVDIISEYVAVQLGNQTYMIDPLRIVGN